MAKNEDKHFKLLYNIVILIYLNNLDKKNTKSSSKIQ